LAKRFNFGIIYGSGAAGLVAVCKKEGAELLIAGGHNPAEVYEMTAEVLKVDLKDPYAYGQIESTVDDLRTESAQEFLDRFYVAYPALDKWTKGVHAFIQKHGYYPSPFGRIRRLAASVNSADAGDQNEAKRQAQNFPVQSAASDIAVVALAAIHADFARRALASVSFAAVHDSLLFDCPLGETREVADLVGRRLSSVKENFAELLPEFDTSWIKVPFETDVEIGPSWGVSFPYREGKMLVESVENGAAEDRYVEIEDFWEWYDRSKEKK
jgi:DNA polymerase I-like protein with 3'-5' exonuclease and polymerase domains